jgi:hypothetical protein
LERKIARVLTTDTLAETRSNLLEKIRVLSQQELWKDPVFRPNKKR